MEDLTCNTAYQFRVSAAGDGSIHTAAWGPATTPVPGHRCGPVFGAEAYTFTVAADVAVGTLVGTVKATVAHDATVSYALTSSDGDAASFTLAASSGALTVAATLAAGTSYQLTVAARAGSGDAAPTNLTATVNTDGHIVLTWTAPDDDSVTGDHILRRRPEQGETTLLVYVADTESTTTTDTDTAVTAGVRHVYRVKAKNLAGLSTWSNYVNPTP